MQGGVGAAWSVCLLPQKRVGQRGWGVRGMGKYYIVMAQLHPRWPGQPAIYPTKGGGKGGAGCVDSPLAVTLLQPHQRNEVTDQPCCFPHPR
jgi:hypothetical protein